jgi:hypothetical protein
MLKRQPEQPRAGEFVFTNYRKKVQTLVPLKYPGLGF